jgi:hypothetical protein
MKIGIVVTVHWSSPDRTQGGFLFDRFIDSIKKSNIEYNFKLYIIDNQSEFNFNLPTDIKYDYFYVENQLAKGLTGAWNLGINKAFSDGCDIVVNTNDDVKFNYSFNYFIEDILNYKEKDTCIFGPRTDKAANGHPNSLPPEETKYTELDVVYGEYKNLLYGFCFALTKNAYINGRYTTDEFFPYKHEMSQGYDVWGSQEGYFSILTKKGFKSILSNRTLFKHLRLNTWMINHPNYDYTKKQIIYKDKNKLIL